MSTLLSLPPELRAMIWCALDWSARQRLGRACTRLLCEFYEELWVLARIRRSPNFRFWRNKMALFDVLRVVEQETGLRASDLKLDTLPTTAYTCVLPVVRGRRRVIVRIRQAVYTQEFQVQICIERRKRETTLLDVTSDEPALDDVVRQQLQLALSFR
jgi:hypothetical protein